MLENYMLLVNQHFDEGEYYEARKVLEAAICLEPRHGQSHSYLGWYYYTQLNNYTTADVHYELALKYAPDFGGTYGNYCVVLYNLKNYVRMIEVAEQGLKAPTACEGEMNYQKALALEGLRMYKEARAALALAIELSTNTDRQEMFKTVDERLKAKIKRITPWYAMLW